MEFWVSYGSTEVPVRVGDDNFYKILDPKKPDSDLPGPRTLLERALETPVGSISLSNIVRPGATVNVLLDPLLPESIQGILLETLKSKLFAQGIGEPVVTSRFRSGIDSKLPNSRRVDPRGGNFVDVGKTSQGTPVAVDSGFRDGTIKILVGIIQPHFASGFIGGPDLVLPGACSLKTVEANRSLGTGSTTDPLRYSDNPIYKDSLEACRMVGDVFLVTVLLDRWGRPAGFFCGELEATFKEAVSEYIRLNSWTLESKPDIIVASSDGPYYSPDLYHGVRILPFLWNIQKRDGSTTILVAECRKGIGDETFLRYSKSNEDRKSLQTMIKKQGFSLGSHVALMLKEGLEKSRVQLVSVLPDVYTRSFGLKPSRTVSAAVQSAIRVEGKDAKVLIIPKASTAIPTLQASAQN